MKLVITLRKDVPDRDEGERIYEVVKTLLQGRPDIEIKGHVTNHFDLEEPES